MISTPQEYESAKGELLNERDRDGTGTKSH